MAKNQLLRRLILPTLLALVAGWALPDGQAVAQVKCPVGEVFNLATKLCEKQHASINTRSATAPASTPASAVQPPDNLRPPTPDLRAVEASAGLKNPATVGAGPCPNATSYAFDPRTGRCVALRSCPGGLIWNPDSGRCVPRPPGGVLECLDGYGYDTQQNKCVPPNCGALVFSLQQNKCVPPPPIVCPRGQKYNLQSSQCVAETYGVLQFVIGTGADNLESDSFAWASWQNPNGTVAYCWLHTDGDSWDNNSTHTIPCDLGNAPMTLAQLQNSKFEIAYNGSYRVQPMSFKNPDNWNLESITINAFNQGERPVCVTSASGDPLHRFQDVGQVIGGGPNGLSSDDYIIVEDYPGHCP